MSADLVAHTARFAAALRAAGVAVGLSDEVDGVEALTRVDLADRDEVERALRIALKVRRRDWALFAALFGRLWGSETTSPPMEAPSARSGPAPAPLGRVRRFGAARNAADGDGGAAAGDAEGDDPGYSAEALLRRKELADCSPAELAAMERLLVRLARRLATRPSRRRKPTRGRGAPDLRRSFRGALGTGGELLHLARRARRVERPELVVLCDTSGSMDPHARLLLAFVLALKSAAGGSEVFAFNTALTRLTPWLAAGKVAATLERLARGVPDWSGGTRIGDCLAEFAERWLAETVTPRTVVVVLSDGLDRGDPAPLAAALAAIHARARKVIWLNPLAGDPRYRPTARGMEAALPYIDHLAPAHNLEALERLLPHLAA
jgi:uncharacterized protein